MNFETLSFFPLLLSFAFSIEKATSSNISVYKWISLSQEVNWSSVREFIRVKAFSGIQFTFKYNFVSNDQENR